MKNLLNFNNVKYSSYVLYNSLFKSLSISVFPFSGTHTGLFTQDSRSTRIRLSAEKHSIRSRSIYIARYVN